MPDNTPDERINWSFRINLDLLEQLHAYATENRLDEDEVIARALDMYFAVEHDMAIITASFNEYDDEIDEDVEDYLEFRREYERRRRRDESWFGPFWDTIDDDDDAAAADSATRGPSFQDLWDNDADSGYDDWRRLYGVDQPGLDEDKNERGG